MDCVHLRIERPARGHPGVVVAESDARTVGELERLPPQEHQQILGHRAAPSIGTCIGRVSIASRRSDMWVARLAWFATCMVTSWDAGHRHRISCSDYLVLRLSDRWADLRRVWGTGGWLGTPRRCRRRVHRNARGITARAAPAKGD